MRARSMPVDSKQTRIDVLDTLLSLLTYPSSFGIGGTFGQMGDPFASAADPIFFMHHANLDRVWWSWQSKDLKKRLKDISGPQIIQDWTNQYGGNVTLDFPLSLGYNNVEAKVSDLMDIRPLCYTYDKLY